MYIGIIDDDLRFRTKWYPNLELMKLASFHKSNRDVVELCTDYRQYERYSKILFGKNLLRDDVPNLFFSKARKKCEYSGLYFTNGIYVPMDKEIEEMRPDTSIYDKINTPEVKMHLRRSLVRLQTDKSIVPIDNFNRFLVYDKDAAIQPLYNELLEIGRTIEFVEPQNFSNLEDAVKFACQKQFNITTIINCNIPLTRDIAQEISGLNFKNSIYFPYIPKKCEDYSELTFAGFLNSVFSEIEYLYKKCPYIKIQNTHKTFLGRYMIDLINGDARHLKSTFFKESKEGCAVLSAYPGFLSRINLLRREVNERKANIK